MNLISKIFGRVKDSPEEPERRQLQPEEASEPTTLKAAFAAKYPRYENILRMFEAANLCEATWENITKVRLQKFVDYMNERLSPNSVNQYATKLKVVLNLYSDEVSLPRGFAKVLTPRKCASTAVYLTEEELQKLVDYSPRNVREEYARDLFVVCAYGGMRHSDALNLNEGNFAGGSLQYVSVKTKIHTVVPLKPVVRDYILNRPQVQIDDTTYNAIIRRICQRCGITERVKVFKAGKEMEGEKWEYVSGHTARRSFASNLYLRGVDLYTISKMLGHTSVKTTEGYIHADIRTDSEELMSYFT